MPSGPQPAHLSASQPSPFRSASVYRTFFPPGPAVLVGTSLPPGSSSKSNRLRLGRSLAWVRATWMPQAMCTRPHGLTDCPALGRLNISLSTEYAAGWGSKFCWPPKTSTGKIMRTMVLNVGSASALSDKACCRTPATRCRRCESSPVRVHQVVPDGRPCPMTSSSPSARCASCWSSARSCGSRSACSKSSICRHR